METSDGKPYNPNLDYATCTCARSGCMKQIRYPVQNAHWRPKYCHQHEQEEAIRLVNTGITEREAYEATHVQMNNLNFKTIQEQIGGGS